MQQAGNGNAIIALSANGSVVTTGLFGHDNVIDSYQGVTPEFILIDIL